MMTQWKKEEDRDKMFESFTQENAQECRDFMYQQVLNREVPNMPPPEEQGVIDGSEGAKIISMNPDNQQLSILKKNHERRKRSKNPNI